MNDPQNIWQNQPTEAIKMSADLMRYKARQLHENARLRAFTRIVIGLILSFCFAWTFARTHELIPRAGWGVLSLWAIYGAYDGFKRILPKALDAAAPVSTSLEFYRSELERQRDYVRHVWRRAGLTFCFLGLAMVVVPALIEALHVPPLLLNMAPLFVLLVIWFLLFFYMKRRNKSKLQRDIDELLVFERENRA